jgi:rhamnulokinase
LADLRDGLHKAAQIAPEGIASIAVDGWAVDYVRLNEQGLPLSEPFCYRDERTIAAKAAVDALITPEDLFRLTGAQPLRLNTLYQFFADAQAGINIHAPWLCLPEYVLYWLGGRRVAEHTNATHTGLVDIKTGDWSRKLFDLLKIPIEAAPPIVPAGTVLGTLQDPLAELTAFRNTQLIAPACHDTASAIAGIASDLSTSAYICSGTWSLVGTLIDSPITSDEAMTARFTNQGAAAGGFCFHTNVNGMWLLKQCMQSWSNAGRPCSIEDLVRRAASVTEIPGIIDVDAEPLLLDQDMPLLINEQLARQGFALIPDKACNEPLFARIIFESLASRYATAIQDLETLLNRKFERIYILGGGSQNKLLTELTAKSMGLPVITGATESSTIGNFAVQLAASTAGDPIQLLSLRGFTEQICL